MNEEQAYWLNKLPLLKPIHIAWDLPQIDLTDKLREVTKYIKPYKIYCYVLVGFNSTPEQDLYRLRRLKELKILPFVQPYRDLENKRVPNSNENGSQWIDWFIYGKHPLFDTYEEALSDGLLQMLKLIKKRE